MNLTRLAPIVIEQVSTGFSTNNDRSRRALVEQNSAMALEVASRAFVLETGTITLSGTLGVLADDRASAEAYLGG